MIERLTILVSLLATAGVGYLIWNQTNNNPTDERRDLLESNLDSTVSQEVEYITNIDTDYQSLVSGAVNKKALWRELIAPPPPPPPKAKVIVPPDFAKLLNGVKPSLRRQVGKGDSLKIIITTLKDPRGKYYKIGDLIGGCEIILITKTEVQVKRTKDKIDYIHSIARKD